MRAEPLDRNARRDDRAPPEPVGQSPERIMQLGFGFRGAKALLSAVELDLFTELAAGPLDCETLRQRLGLHRRGVRDFLDALVALGLLKRQGGRYGNVPEADVYLDRTKPTYIGGILQLANSWVYPNWCHLTEALKTGRPQNEVEDGEDLFDMLRRDPDAARRFAQAMTGASLPTAWALSRRFPWSDYGSFVDVGTAEGAVAVEIARAHPHLVGGGLDLPEMRPVFEAYVARHGMEDRVRFHAGDFFRGPLPSADVLVMGQILHDWDLDTKRELLAAAHATLAEGAALIVCDQMIDSERRENVAGLLMSLSMLVNTRGGFDYTATECIAWMRDAGFATVRAEHLTGPYTMVVGVK